MKTKMEVQEMLESNVERFYRYIEKGTIHRETRTRVLLLADILGPDIPDGIREKVEEIREW